MIPTPLWLVLFFTSALIFVFMLFFADSGERAVVQAHADGTVVAVIVSMLLLLQFLDNPFHKGVGGLRPVAMQRTLKVIDQELTPTQRVAASVRRPRQPALATRSLRCERTRVPRSRTIVSIGCPLTTSGPSHGALSANSNARLNATTTASPTINSEVRTLERNVSAPAFAMSATPLATSVSTYSIGSSREAAAKRSRRAVVSESSAVRSSVLVGVLTPWAGPLRADQRSGSPCGQLRGPPLGASRSAATRGRGCARR